MPRRSSTTTPTTSTSIDPIRAGTSVHRWTIRTSSPCHQPVSNVGKPSQVSSTSIARPDDQPNSPQLTAYEVIMKRYGRSDEVLPGPVDGLEFVRKARLRLHDPADVGGAPAVQHQVVLLAAVVVVEGEDPVGPIVEAVVADAPGLRVGAFGGVRVDAHELRRLRRLPVRVLRPADHPDDAGARAVQDDVVLLAGAPVVVGEQ